MFSDENGITAFFERYRQGNKGNAPEPTFDDIKEIEDIYLVAPHFVTTPSKTKFSAYTLDVSAKRSSDDDWSIEISCIGQYLVPLTKEDGIGRIHLSGLPLSKELAHANEIANITNMLENLDYQRHNTTASALDGYPEEPSYTNYIKEHLSTSQLFSSLEDLHHSLTEKNQATALRTEQYRNIIGHIPEVTMAQAQSLYKEKQIEDRRLQSQRHGLDKIL